VEGDKSRVRMFREQAISGRQHGLLRWKLWPVKTPVWVLGELLRNARWYGAPGERTLRGR